MDIHIVHKGETATIQKKTDIWCKMATLKFTTDIHKHLPHYFTSRSPKYVQQIKVGKMRQDLTEK